MMRICIILISLSFVQIVFCSNNINFTEDYHGDVCPVALVRHKRANMGYIYTRWRNNEETTEEFLVKILDDDTAPIIAVNIQPETRVTEKIIVGGVMVPSHSPSKSLAEDYKRFNAPTIVPDTVNLNLKVSSPSDNSQPIRPRGWSGNIGIIPQAVPKHALRDESPPASPQFLARTPELIARQFAPITPVAFSRRAGVMPPTLTSIMLGIIKPVRSTLASTSFVEVPRTTTNIEEIHNFQSLIDDEIISHTVPKYNPIRSTVMFNKIDDDIMHGTAQIDETHKRRYNVEKPISEQSEKEADAIYNLMFYNDLDTIEYVTKQEYANSEETFYEKSVTTDDNNIIESVSTEIVSAEMSTMRINSTVLDSETFEDSNDSREELDTTNKYNDDISPVTPIIANLEFTKTKYREKRRHTCNLLKLRPLNFNSPQTLPEIVMQMKRWAGESPLAKWIDITNGNLTTMENPIYMMIIDDPSSGQIITAKETVLIVAGIQGRDHHAVSAAMYVLYQLIERNEAHTDLLSKFRFWVIPVFNPDGYDYSLTFSHKREWSKNLHQSWNTCNGQESCQLCHRHGIGCTPQPCFGVNLDRNFEYQWIPPDELRTEHPCGSLHAGARQLSEPETHALTHFLHEQRAPIFTFIAFKEGDVLGVMYPYSHTKKKRAFDHVYRQRASRAASAAFSISGRPYVAGQTSEFLPLYAGGIEDWVDGHLGIDNTYSIMIFRPTDTFNPKLHTERIVHEAYAAMDTLLLQSVLPLSPINPVKLVQQASASIITKSTSVFIVSLIILTALSCR